MTEAIQTNHIETLISSIDQATGGELVTPHTEIGIGGALSFKLVVVDGPAERLRVTIDVPESLDQIHEAARPTVWPIVGEFEVTAGPGSYRIPAAFDLLAHVTSGGATAPSRLNAWLRARWTIERGPITAAVYSLQTVD